MNVTGTITRLGLETYPSEPATEVEGGKRVRIGGFSTLTCTRSESIFRQFPSRIYSID
jgi:hypothetical protein